MILALVVARYMWLDVFSRRFPDPADLAAFIGVFLAVTNLIEIAIEMSVTPWLIRRIGVPSTNLVHPTADASQFRRVGFSVQRGLGSVRAHETERCWRMR